MGNCFLCFCFFAMTDFLGMQKDVSSVSGTPGMQVRSIKGLLSEEVTPQSGTASTGISVRTPASTTTAIMEEKKISEKESLHIQKSKEYLKLVTTDLEDYLRSLRVTAPNGHKASLHSGPFFVQMIHHLLSVVDPVHWRSRFV